MNNNKYDKNGIMTSANNIIKKNKTESMIRRLLLEFWYIC